VAEIVNEYCKKGNPLFVSGRLQLDVWDDKTTGQKRSKLKVIGENIQLLGSKPSTSAESPDDRAAARKQPPAQKQPPPKDPDLDPKEDDGPFD
jgi:single-strand DNA-binding protein